MAKHMKKKNLTWRELFEKIECCAKRDGDGVWDLPVAMWYDDEDTLYSNSAYTFYDIDQMVYEYPSYEPAPLSDDNWLILCVNQDED